MKPRQPDSKQRGCQFRQKEQILEDERDHAVEALSPFSPDGAFLLADKETI